MKGVKAILGLVIITLPFVLIVSPTSAKEIDLDPGNTIDELIDCGIWADNPEKIGSVVHGNVEVSCLTSHSRIIVYISIGRFTDPEKQTEVAFNYKNCRYTDTCSVSVDATYTGGYYWVTHGSGYVGSWNAYYQSDWVYIP